MTDVIDGQATLQTAPTTPPSSDWRPYLNDELKADPVVSGWAEKASYKDIPAIIKGFAHAQKRMGSAINLPSADTKPEEIDALRQKLYQAGVFKAPPSKPEEYGLQKPENLPAGVNWSDELATKFSQALHKHGVPKEAAADLLPLYFESLGQQAQLSKTSQEEGMKVLREEFKDKFDAHLESAKRIFASIFKNPGEEELFNKLGLGNEPRFIGPLMRMARLGDQDSSFIDGASGTKPGARDHASVKAELQSIMTDPKHPMHAGWIHHDRAIMDHVQNMYKQLEGMK